MSPAFSLLVLYSRAKNNNSTIHWIDEESVWANKVEWVFNHMTSFQVSLWTKLWNMPNSGIHCSLMTSTCSITYRTGMVRTDTNIVEGYQKTRLHTLEWTGSVTDKSRQRRQSATFWQLRSKQFWIAQNWVAWGALQSVQWMTPSVLRRLKCFSVKRKSYDDFVVST